MMKFLLIIALVFGITYIGFIIWFIDKHIWVPPLNQANVFALIYAVLSIGFTLVGMILCVRRVQGHNVYDKNLPPY
jgi:predicted permease